MAVPCSCRALHIERGGSKMEGTSNPASPKVRMTSFAFRSARAAAVLLLSVTVTLACTAQDKTIVKDDLNTSFRAPAQEYDYVKRVEMVPMRDGTKLYTVIVIPRGAKNVPIVLTRTPYNAAGRAERVKSTKMLEELPLSDEVFVRAGWIRVYQDVRGKYGSEGAYLMTPPQVGPYNPTGADDTTDAYDTIDWLVKNVPEANGRVAMIGSSYEGFTVVMALLHPHPALKVTAPESPMVDGWMGDDWFHYGAFRQPSLDYVLGQTSARGRGAEVQRNATDDYTNYLRAGSAGDRAREMGLDQLPYWKTVEAHPAYDGFWQSQALDHLIAKTPLTVPTMWLQGLWDQEDMWGAIHSWTAWEPQDKNNNLNYLVMGPWRHSQVNREGRSLGPLVWGTDTTDTFRREVLFPFFRQYLVEGAPVAKTPPVYIYNTGEDHWTAHDHWPLSCDSGCQNPAKPMYLAPGGKLSFDAPAAGEDKADEYISDPAKPVPYRPRPIDEADGQWGQWLVLDQRFVDGRPDVLTYETEPLKEPMQVSGAPIVNLWASTSGTDSDWAVKIIDVYPDREAPPKAMNGYELGISLDIFRGRYRTSFEHPEAIKPNTPLLYKFALPTVNHVFQPGHRIMVQVQSTLFPLYDRNPQTFVPNIFDAKPADYVKATQKVWHTPGHATFIEMPVVPYKPSLE